MKKILLLAIAIVSFSAITSCGGDDDQASLQGKWEYSKEGVAAGGQEVLVDYEHTTGCTKDFMIVGATSVADHSFFGDDCTEDVSTSAYTRNGNTLSFTVDGVTYTSEIKTLDGSTLKIYSTNPDLPQITNVSVYKRVN